MLLALSFACADPSAEPPTGTGDPTDVDPAAWPDVVGGDRPAAVVAPSTWDGTPLPVVLVLHGYGATGALQDAYFQLSAHAEDEGFVAILPDGTVDTTGLRFWNGTPACCDLYGDGVDDVSYLLGLLDEVEAAIPIDPDRITILGHSNGGFMAYRLACEAPERFAGIASLAGSTFASEESCAATEPVAVLQMHGTVDDTIFYEGLPFAWPSADETVARWAERAGCTSGPDEGGAHDHDSAVAGAETLEIGYGGCERDVRLWRMVGSGHIPLPTAAYQDDVRAWLLAR